MKKLIALIIGVVLAVTVAAAAPPTPPQVSDPAHLAAVADMLLAAHVPQMERYAFIENAIDKPDPKAYIRHISDAALAQVLAPIYVRYVPIDAAMQLTAAYNTPQARMTLAYEMALSRSRDGKNLPKLTVQDRKDVKQFRASSVVATLAAVQEQASRAVMDRMGYLFSNDSMIIVMKGGQARAAYMQTLLEAGGAQEPVKFIHAKEGVPYADQLNELFAQLDFDAAHATWRTDKELTALEFDAVLDPANLVTAQGVARGKRVLSLVDRQYDTLLRETDAALNAAAATFASIDMPAQQVREQMLQQILATQRDANTRMVASQRAIVSMMRDILKLAESRLGQSWLRGKALVIDDAADMARYHAMLADIDREVARYDAMRAEIVKSVGDAAAGKMPPLERRP